MAQSIVAIFVALLLVSMKVCCARHTPGFGIYSKDVAYEKTNLEREMDFKVRPASEDTKETYLGGISMSMLDGSRSTIGISQGLERNERLMQESESHESEEAADASQDEPVEDTVVMDYVTPHRKSPIHNSHH